MEKKKKKKMMMEALEFVMAVEFWRMAVLWTFCLLLSYWKLIASNSCPSKPPPSPSAFGHRPLCIITGATSGLGAAAAHALSAHDFFVVLVGRSSHLLAKTMMDIKTQNKNAHLKAFQVDLASFDSILQFKASLQKWLSDSEMHSSIQLLINNAGILATSSRLTCQGYDQMMATNYLGAFSLTKLLLPLLRNSPIPSRIVNVNKDIVSGKCFGRSKRYPYAHVYEYSKLFLLLFSYELHRQLGLMDISHQCCGSWICGNQHHARSSLMPIQSGFHSSKTSGLLQSPEIGVSSILDAALAPPETSGVYYFGGNGGTVNSSVLSYDAKLAKELWNASSDLFLESELASKETISVSNGIS
ncbi:NAD(P)-binding Rossmann-fold superfamily protein [Prunus dulcis]|uniref:NAD(P)-binding Rossmann-fold superfamily protein n=1 Tax=Prunus dulcis TaxID=3755 RepID=A0A4Y1RQP8_PRUDU|nr:NAD(P)-binding Rossmann-fold superfamily protein [Prunus dulcis]